MVIDYPEKINRLPKTDGLDSMFSIFVDVLALKFTADIDETIRNIRDDYQDVRNESLMPATNRTEQCLFRLYEAKYLIMPHCDVDLLGFAFDDAYHDFVANKVAKECYDAAKGEGEYTMALECVKLKNYAAAGEHFRLAALNGHAAAQYNYGVSVTNGEVGEADALEGAFWYFIAAKNGSEKAMINLAVAYRTGKGVLPNGPMMLHWYATAACIPFPYGVYNLGLCLENEEVISGNASLGTSLKRASEQLQDEEMRGFAIDVAEQVVSILKEYVYNV